MQIINEKTYVIFNNDDYVLPSGITKDKKYEVISKNLELVVIIKDNGIISL